MSLPHAQGFEFLDVGSERGALVIVLTILSACWLAAMIAGVLMLQPAYFLLASAIVAYTGWGLWIRKEVRGRVF